MDVIQNIFWHVFRYCNDVFFLINIFGIGFNKQPARPTEQKNSFETAAKTIISTATQKQLGPKWMAHPSTLEPVDIPKKRKNWNWVKWVEDMNHSL